jgi:hypothetical protein
MKLPNINKMNILKIDLKSNENKNKERLTSMQNNNFSTKKDVMPY